MCTVKSTRHNVVSTPALSWEKRQMATPSGIAICLVLSGVSSGLTYPNNHPKRWALS